MKNSFTKIMMTALLLTMAVPCVNAQIAHVGDILCTTGVYVSPAEYEASGLEAMGVIFYVDATGQHGWAVALEDAGSLKWATNTYDIPIDNYSGVRAAIYDLNGFFNTQEVINYGINNNCSFPAFEAVDFANGWYVPALGQLNYLYGNLVEINTALIVCGGTAFEMSTNWRYWSSTEHSGGYAWWLKSTGEMVTFGTNTSSYGSYDSAKYCQYKVRAIRNF